MENRISPISNNVITQKANIAFGGRYSISAITHDRKVLNFDSTKDAVEKTGILRANIHNIICEKNPQKSAKGLVFRKTKDILDTEQKIDPKKVKKAAENLHSICIIDKNLNIYTPLNNKDAISLSGLNEGSYYRYLSEQRLTPKGKLVTPRVNIEDEYGNLSIEKAQALREKIQHESEVGGFYAVSPDKQVSYHKTCTDFAKIIGKHRSVVHQCLIGQVKKVSGYVILRRNLVENEAGKLDAEKLKTALEQRLTSRRKPYKKITSDIVAIHKNGDTKVFHGLEATEEGTGRGAATILPILKGKKSATKTGWHYAFADNFKDESGKLSPEKIKARFEQIFKREN